MTASNDSGNNTEAALRNAYASRGGSGAVFSNKVADYVASRPDYPPALFDRLAELGAFAPQGTAADIGAGTGLLTASLIACGLQVVAVEPNAAMRAAADARFAGVPAYRSVEGSAESTTLAAGSIDLITAAQAFHWFAVDEARAEFLRILKPRGQVALIWNDRVDDDPLQQAIVEVFTRHGGAQRSALAAHEERLSVAPFFGNATPHAIDLPHTQRLGRDGLRALVFSRSYMPPRESEAGHAASREIDAVFDAFARDGRVEVNYRTLAFVGRPA